jgi:hypothetical protein
MIAGIGALGRGKRRGQWEKELNALDLERVQQKTFCG